VIMSVRVEVYICIHIEVRFVKRDVEIRNFDNTATTLGSSTS
jgi:hypothetical protein